MRISISIVTSDVEVSQDFIPLEVFPDMTLDSIKYFIQEEINIAPASQHFVHKNKVITNNSQTLTQLGLSEGDVLPLVIRSEQAGPSRGYTGASSGGLGSGQRLGGGSEEQDAETLRLQLLGDPRLLSQVRAQDPELAESTSSPQTFSRLWTLRARQRAEAQAEKERALALLDADPFNPEAQAKIEEIIRQERVAENMQKALEDNPEAFARVTMLYIDVLVNNVPIKAFVDSGAQTTIMSPDAAERCGIMRLIDRRWAGMARGVGTAPFIGRVHTADMQIGPYVLASSFTVMEGKDVDLLLGLDMLKRHQMCIDLKHNCLRILEEQVPFLSESEAPKMMEEILEKEPKVEGPGGTKIGTETGTMQPQGGLSQASVSTSASASASAQAATPGSSSAATGQARATPMNPQPNPSSQSQPQPYSEPVVANTFGAPSAITEQSIAQVTELGFSREEAITALQQAQGNIELAIGLLL